jgi:hypothetical protein
VRAAAPFAVTAGFAAWTEVLAGNFLERQESVALGTVIDETGFE